MRTWDQATIETYKPLGTIDGWKHCPKCDELPRTWTFDNGRYAKCLCAERYGAAMATAESVNSVRHRTGKVVDYRPDDLRLAWNEYADSGIRTMLAVGQW